MNLINCRPPHVEVAKVHVHQGQVEWGILISLPRHIYHNGARNINASEAHSLDVIQTVDEALEVAAMPELRLHGILLKVCAIDIIVCGVSIYKLVEEKGVEREPPISRRRCEIVL